ncbi:ATP-binding cassette domain-containing protein [Chryseobacterium nematophagum]|uniref:ATP-binding cassette domain-containing protein n=1 Tax=Chryseobacterium nematophagum TaxID=2305228 RepID=A0A3M7TDM5_9FLAO|nr:ATP-binding cassette domain-containing protein [Chryseobacterium nematophagum]RNA61154.1 ATP-binding cassette domain-containing protein [Chryseobacterium nematophagum]
MLDLNIETISYRKKIILKDIKISILQFGLYGFFGKNGEGKTTFLKSLCDLVSYKGEILFCENILKPSTVAWIPTETDVYDYLTIDEFHKFYRLSSRNHNSSEKKIFELDKNKLLKECSTGTKKKAYIDAVLQFSDYSLYIFDEPFNGLDIESNYILLNHIIELSKHNIVFISSHIIELVEPYLDKKYIVKNQTIQEVTKLQGLKSFFIDA